MMDREKEFRLQMSREKWLRVHAALAVAYEACKIAEERCEVCQEWKETAKSIEKRLPRSMMSYPCAMWKKATE